MGWSTVRAIVGGGVAPGIADRVLARGGYDSQQTSEPEDPTRADNLDAPVEGDRGAHGRFAARSSAHSPQQWVSRNRGWLLGLGLGTASVAACFGWRRRRV